MNTNLSFALLIGLVFGIIVGAVMYGLFRLHIWSSITLAILATYLIINLGYPIGFLTQEKDSNAIALYLFIELFVPIYLLIVLVVLLFCYKRDPAEELDFELLLL